MFKEDEATGLPKRPKKRRAKPKGKRTDGLPTIKEEKVTTNQTRTPTKTSYSGEDDEEQSSTTSEISARRRSA